MTRIPFSGLDGQTQPGTIQAPDDYQRVQADPNAFGASVAQAGQQVGGDIQKVGGEVFDAAQSAQQFQDRVANTESLNTLQDGMRAAQFGDPNNPNDVGYYGTKGKAALDAYPDAVQRVNDLRDSISSNMTDPRQQQMFDQQSRRLINSTLDTMARHRQQQLTTYGVDTQKAAVGSSLADAGMFYNDDAAFTNHLTDAVTAQRQADATAGVSPEASDLNVRDVISTGWAGRIKRLAADDPIAANKMLQGNLDQLLPGMQTQLIDGLKAQVRSKEASSIGDGLPGGPSGSDQSLPRGLRNNNPLNLSYVQGQQGVIGSDGRFGQYAKPEDGIAASVQQMQLYQSRDGLTTPRQIINKWAPSSENNVTSYVNTVAQATGINPDKPIDMRDPAQATALVRGMAQVETGRVLDPGVAQRGVQAAMAGGTAVSSTSGQDATRVASAATSMNDASGPPAAPQTQADYLRENYDSLLQDARDQATRLHPEDPTFADLAVARRQQTMNRVIGAQKQSYEADSNTLWQAANGDLNKGTAPGTIDQLVASSPAAAAAWQRVQTQQPQLAHSIATRVLSQAADPDKDKDAATYGPAFYSTFRNIHAPDGSASKITDPDQLYSLLGNGLTMAGVAKAREEIMSRRTPEGEADAQMRTEFFKTAKGQISGADDGLGIKDPKGEEIYLRFMGAALPAIQAAKAKGLTGAQIYNPDSPDYVGKMIPGFKRSLAQRTADMMGSDAAVPKAPDPPGFWHSLFGGASAATAPDLSTAEGIRSAVQTGKMTRQEAVGRLRGLNAPAAAALTPAATETLPSGPQVPTSD